MNVGNWKNIKAKGIEGDNVSFKFLSFFTRDTAVLLGSTITDADLINKRFYNFDALACIPLMAETPGMKRK
jgi:hypothetical protein